jgi:hypothetical protein
MTDVKRRAIDAELAVRGLVALSEAEWLALIPHSWTVEKCANMIGQLRRVKHERR